ncbi:MAG TPA: tetratricopeptide repeat protein [Gemmatimonadaceae bacterium]|nr:tetratricopeptide repeat protein [Gemmatimonadaceae bacterium]
MASEFPAWAPWALAAVTLLVFIRVTGNGFINFDDDAYITTNPHVLGGLTADNVRWALTNVAYFCWQPLTWLSHQLDVTLFGLNPGPPHFINALIHALNAALCFRLLKRITGRDWAALVGAALWALHPLRVESVAWAAERKDVLSVCFYLLATIWYVERRAYWQTTLWFVLGMAAKPTLVSFPVVVTMLDVWPLGRWNLREKIPWFVLAALLSIVTVKGAATMGATAALGALPLGVRVAHACWSYLLYVVQTVWPFGLAVIYPYSETIPAWQPVLGLAFIVGASVAAWRFRARYPGALLGWAWYVVTLAPMSGVVQAGPQMGADRYSYVPAIGLMLVVISVWPRVRVAGLVLAGALGVVTFRQISYWKGSVTVFEHAMAVTSNNWIAMRNLGGAYITAGDTLRAVALFKQSLSLTPNQPETNYQFGSVLAAKNDWARALPYFDAALKLSPRYASAEYARGTALAHAGKSAEAAQSLERALTLELAPSYKAEAHNTLGVIAINAGDRAGAERHFKEALVLNPALEVAQRNLTALRTMR